MSNQDGPDKLRKLALTSGLSEAALIELADKWDAERREAKVIAKALRLLAGTLSTYAPFIMRHPDNVVEEYVDLARVGGQT